MIKHFVSYRTRIIILFLLIGASIASQLALGQIPDQPINYVSDPAQLLTESEENILNQTLKVFEDSTTHQIFVLLAQSSEGRSIEELTLETAMRWGVGQKGQDNGVLIAIYAEDRKMRFEVGYGLEADFTDVQTQYIQQTNMIPFLKNEDYFGAIQSGILATINEITDAPQANQTRNNSPQYAFSYPDEPGEGWSLLDIAMLIGGIMGILISHFLIGKIIQALGERMKNGWFRFMVLILGHSLYCFFVPLAMIDKLGFETVSIIAFDPFALEGLFLFWGFLWMNSLSNWVEIASFIYYDPAKRNDFIFWKRLSPANSSEKSYQTYPWVNKVGYYIANLLRTTIIWMLFISIILLIKGNNSEEFPFLILSGFGMIIYGMITGKIESDRNGGGYSSSSGGGGGIFGGGSSFGGGGGSFGGGGSSSSW